MDRPFSWATRLELQRSQVENRDSFCALDVGTNEFYLETMKTVLFASLAASAAAFTSQSASKASTALNGAKEDLKSIAEASNPVLKVRETSENGTTL